MTQKRVRSIMSMWYSDEPLGMSGDEDYGEMSSWYVLNAIGFYTVCPGQPVYNIGSPIFKKAIIDIGNGKTFVVKARNVSARNKYIQSATLNGKALNRPWFEHTDLKNGGTLTLQMGPIPNKAWGSAPEDAPPSMTPACGAETLEQ
jgi:putative alpha-1,2-mannosidase